MGSSESKIRCLFLPAQSGKTRKVEEEITEFKRLCGIEGSRSIDIVISANNRLLVYQTSARLRKDLGTAATPDDDDTDTTESESVVSDVTDDTPESTSDAVIKGRIFSWTCGRSSNISEELLTYKLAEEEVELVMMCANKRRMTYLATLLKRLLTVKSFRRDPAKIYIWIDEADSSMSIWRQFESVLENPAITQVTFVSATFGRVLKRYKSLRVIPYKQTHPDCYRRLVDCQQEIVACGLKDPCQFVLYVLSKQPARMAAGQRAFIPGAYTKESHYEIADELSKLGFATVIINGECKELRIPDEDTINLADYLSCPDPEMLPPEFNQTLAALYKDHRLARFPFAITGYLCIQRGVTFQCAPADDGAHDGFVFDYGIVPPIRDKAEAYQTMARMFGNTGHFPNYVRPTIYTDEKTFAGVRDQEETAVHLPRIVFEEGLESVDKADFERAAKLVSKPTVDPATYRIVFAGSEEETLKIAKDIAKDLKIRFTTPHRDEATGRFKTSLNDKSRVRSLEEAISGVPRLSRSYTVSGPGAFRSCIPGYHDDQLYIVILLVGKEITTETIHEIDTNYADYLVPFVSEETSDTIAHV
jgi:hypothetical protein